MWIFYSCNHFVTVTSSQLMFYAKKKKDVRIIQLLASNRPQYFVGAMFTVL